MSIRSAHFVNTADSSPKELDKYANETHTETDLEAIRRSVVRDAFFGLDDWVAQSAVRLQLKHTLRPRGKQNASK